MDILEFSKEAESIRYIHKEIYYEGLAHVILDAEKSKDLLPKKATGIIPVQT